MPCVQIVPELPPALPQSAEVVVFVSSNAVDNGLAAGLKPLVESAKEVLAVGPATAAALGPTRADVITPSCHNSEGLLALPLWASLPRGARVLIVKGRNGRTALGDGLRQRGLEPMELDTYARKLPAPDPAAMAQFRAAGAAAYVVLLSSTEIFTNLRALLRAADRDWMDSHVHYVCVSQRIASFVEASLSRAAAGRRWLLDGAGVDDIVAGLDRHWRNVRQTHGKKLQ